MVHGDASIRGRPCALPTAILAQPFRLIGRRLSPHAALCRTEAVLHHEFAGFFSLYQSEFTAQPDRSRRATAPITRRVITVEAMLRLRARSALFEGGNQNRESGGGGSWSTIN